MNEKILGEIIAFIDIEDEVKKDAKSIIEKVRFFKLFQTSPFLVDY